MLRFTTAGESHGPALISILEGAPAGIPLLADDVNAELSRRQQGYGRGRRMQIEKDGVEILSGVRAGYTIQDNLLIYATGGLANGTAKGSFSAIGSGNGAIGSRSKTLWGWNVGGGLEYGLGPWSAKVEYLHYDIGTLTFYTIDFNSGALIRAQTKFAGDMVRVGVNYRFAWTPWQLIFGR